MRWVGEHWTVLGREKRCLGPIKGEWGFWLFKLLYLEGLQRPGAHLQTLLFPEDGGRIVLYTFSDQPLGHSSHPECQCLWPAFAYVLVLGHVSLGSLGLGGCQDALIVSLEDPCLSHCCSGLLRSWGDGSGQLVPVGPTALTLQA